MNRITRRTVLKILTSLFFVVPSISSARNISTSLLPETVNNRGITLTEFVALSRLLTRTDDPDETVSQNIYRLLMQESWGPENLRQVYSRIRELQQIPGNNFKTILHKSNFSSDSQWFISHILVTWYTGVYYHIRGNEHVTLKKALMYRVQTEYRQPPTYCSGKSGFWFEPPTKQLKIRKKLRNET